MHRVVREAADVLLVHVLVVSIAHVRVNDLRGRDLLVRVVVARSGVVGHRRDDRNRIHANVLDVVRHRIGAGAERVLEA